MKESLSYKVLITMKKRNRLKQNAVDRGKSFETDNSYHYDGAGKRLSDLCNYGYAERKWDDRNGYMLYQVSEKWLEVKGFKDFKENTIKMKQYRASAKKTREESAVKMENIKMNISQSIIDDKPWVMKESVVQKIIVLQPRYKRLRSALTRA